MSRGGRRFVKFDENFSPSNPRELAGINSPPGLRPDCLTYVIEVAFHDCELRQAWKSGKRSVWTTRLEVKPRPEISQSYRCLYDTHFLATKILFRRLLPKLRAVKAVAVINTQAVRGIGCIAKQIRRLRLLSRRNPKAVEQRLMRSIQIVSLSLKRVFEIFGFSALEATNLTSLLRRFGVRSL